MDRKGFIRDYIGLRGGIGELEEREKTALVSLNEAAGNARVTYKGGGTVKMSKGIAYFSDYLDARATARKIGADSPTLFGLGYAVQYTVGGDYYPGREPPEVRRDMEKMYGKRGRFSKMAGLSR